MPIVLLVRHGRTAANAEGVLAGWTPGVALDETGLAQARALAQRLAVLPLAAVVTSPLQRCCETAAAVAAVDGPPLRTTVAKARAASNAVVTALVARPQPVIDDRLGECRYGSWTGRSLKELAKDPLWRAVQVHPSGVRFPGPDGESMRAMQERAVCAVREHDARVASEHGEGAVWVAVSHGDVIKAVLADALGMHLDAFQRLVVDPCSVSAVRYTPLRPFALRVNDTGGDLASLQPARQAGRARGRGAGTGTRSRRSEADDEAASDAVVGGAAS